MLCDEPVDRHFHVIRVAGVAVAIGKRFFHGLEQDMDRIRRAKPHLGKIELLKDVQHFDHMHTARRRWRYPDDFVSPIRPADRCTLDRPVLLQVLHRNDPAVAGKVITHNRAERTVIQVVWTVFGNRP